ncbi:hypothetical protein AAG747_25495 [Rapidithrix thailandica]|uniref:Uncharacterized protein n=1 Tax=Rapidithrix thailandica TaxID=413964 RepID=A0AAW9SJ80_9BACT
MDAIQFTYKAKFSYLNKFLPPLVLGGIGAYCYLEQVSISIKRRLTILPYPYSFYVFGGAGILLLAYAIYKLVQYIKASQNHHDITLTEKYITFPQGSSEKVQVYYDEVQSLYIQEDSEDGESITIDVNNNSYKFQEEYFSSLSQYTDFKAILEKLCTKLTH